MAQRFQSSQTNDLTYLPNSLMLSSVPENDMIGMTRSSGSSYDDDEYVGGKPNKVKKSRSDDTSGSNSPNSSGDFYLYRQPQLNRTLWETKPRIGNW
jgi:hypothetical protein